MPQNNNEMTAITGSNKIRDNLWGNDKVVPTRLNENIVTNLPT